jgi:hypothetical protein
MVAAGSPYIAICSSVWTVPAAHRMVAACTVHTLLYVAALAVWCEWLGQFVNVTVGSSTGAVCECDSGKFNWGSL